MRLKTLLVLACTSLLCYACTDSGIVVTFDGDKATATQSRVDSVDVSIDGTTVLVDNHAKSTPLRLTLKGKCDDGCVQLKTKTKDRIVLDDLSLTSNEGAPLVLKNKHRVTVEAVGNNSLAITACSDTAKHKSAAIWSKGKLTLTGKGTLNVLASGNGCKGINAKKDIDIESLTLDVRTTGDNLGIDSTRMMPMGPPPGAFDPDKMPKEMKEGFEKMRKYFEEKAAKGELPMMGPPPHMGGPGGMPQMGGPMGPPQGGPGMGGPMGKQKYIGTCKGIKSGKTLTISSGTVTVSTKSAGAEGIEGKESIVINGGVVSVDAIDDAVNSNGKIFFNGGKVTAISHNNDAVDSNAGGDFMEAMFHRGDKDAKEAEPAIIITGGEVYAWSQNGAPEEGIDCDFSPIKVSGGKIFSIGAGMGELPSVPTQKTAIQPTALYVGIDMEEGKPVQLLDSKGKVLCEFDAPFTFGRSSSLITTPEMRIGEKYTVKSAGKTYEIEMKEQFTTIGASGKGGFFPMPYNK